MPDTRRDQASITIRRFRADDRDDVARVCLQTGAAGGDATGLYSDDLVVSDIAALPYLVYQPDLAFVVDDSERVVGYVIGVADTAGFVEWWKASWAPSFASRHDKPTDPTAPSGSIPEAHLHAAAMTPEYMLLPEVEQYPAHLHIDLLPQVQAQGLGRDLTHRFLAQLADRGVPGLHLGVDAENVGALAFYHKLGFHELSSSSAEHRVLGISIPPRKPYPLS